MPDDPGLFDGHVWPMYLKHRKLMEDNGLDIGKIQKLWLCNSFFFLNWHFYRQTNLATLVVLTFFFFSTLFNLTLCVVEYIDGLKSKDEIYTRVYEDIQSSLLNRL